jgi:hypothetical protein
MELDPELRMILQQFDTFCGAILMVLQENERGARVAAKKNRTAGRRTAKRRAAWAKRSPIREWVLQSQTVAPPPAVSVEVTSGLA